MERLVPLINQARASHVIYLSSGELRTLASSPPAYRVIGALVNSRAKVLLEEQGEGARVLNGLALAHLWQEADLA